MFQILEEVYSVNRSKIFISGRYHSFTVLTSLGANLLKSKTAKGGSANPVNSFNATFKCSLRSFKTKHPLAVGCQAEALSFFSP